MNRYLFLAICKHLSWLDIEILRQHLNLVSFVIHHPDLTEQHQVARVVSLLLLCHTVQSVLMVLWVINLPIQRIKDLTSWKSALMCLVYTWTKESLMDNFQSVWNHVVVFRQSSETCQDLIVNSFRKQNLVKRIKLRCDRLRLLILLWLLILRRSFLAH